MAISTTWQLSGARLEEAKGIINEFETEEIILKPENTTVKDFALKSKKRLCSA